MHKDTTLKKISPSIDVVTRQTANIKRRYRSNNDEEMDTHHPPPCYYTITGVMTHPGVSVVLAWKMDEQRIRLARQVESTLHLSGHTRCECCYLSAVSLSVCWTTKEMRRRHYSHRDEIKRRSDGI